MRAGRWGVAALTAPLVVVFGTAAVGNALAPALLADHPAVLLALNATTRHLVLTSTTVDVVPWVLLGLGRRLLEDPFLYLLGRRHGDEALAWIDRKVGGGRWLCLVRRRFRLLGLPLVALAPGGVVCLLAGASGMGGAAFLVLNVGGTLATLVVLRAFGAEAADPIDDLVAFAGRNPVPLTAASVAVTALLLWRRRAAVSSGTGRRARTRPACRRGGPRSPNGWRGRRRA